MSAPSPFEFLEDDALRAAMARESVGIVPAGLKTKDDLFDALSTLFQAPEWFGRNWDALLDLLRDPFIGGTELKQLVHEDLPLEDRIEQAMYLETLADAIADQRAAGEVALIASFPVAFAPEVCARLPEA